MKSLMSTLSFTMMMAISVQEQVTEVDKLQS